MAGYNLYPPIIEDHMPTFAIYANNGNRQINNVCKVYFSLSKFNIGSDFSSVQAVITKQDTGRNVVRKEDDNGRFRSTGVILDIPFKYDEENGYYIEINDYDLATQWSSFTGWVPGCIYKIQIRLTGFTSTNEPVTYENRDAINQGHLGQSAWLTQNANYFSEWSTMCILKPIGPGQFLSNTIVHLKGEHEDDPGMPYFYSFPSVMTTYINMADASEVLQSFRFKLYSSKIVNSKFETDELLEDSGEILTGRYVNPNQVNYSLIYDTVPEEYYFLSLTYKTINDYEDTVWYAGYYVRPVGSDCTLQVISADGSVKADHSRHGEDSDAETNLLEMREMVAQGAIDEDDGRITLQVVAQSDTSAGDFILVRSESKENFKKWKDIKLIHLTSTIGKGDVLPYIYDNTAESGVFYKYGIQTYDAKNDIRGPINAMSFPIMRDYSYSYLLGENEQLLKINLNTNVSSYNISVSDTPLDTIGGRYPFISRNGNMYYKKMQITGTISFNMDENEIFLNKKDIFGNDEIVQLYEDYNTVKRINTYDYIYEKEFREKVLQFLYSPTPKLFKSASEGNILVRLTDISLSPSQGTARMVYDFSMTATEIGEPTLDNFKKYKLLLKEIEVTG